MLPSVAWAGVVFLSALLGGNAPLLAKSIRLPSDRVVAMMTALCGGVCLAVGCVVAGEAMGNSGADRRIASAIASTAFVVILGCDRLGTHLTARWLPITAGDSGDVRPSGVYDEENPCTPHWGRDESSCRAMGGSDVGSEEPQCVMSSCYQNTCTPTAQHACVGPHPPALASGENRALHAAAGCPHRRILETPRGGVDQSAFHVVASEPLIEVSGKDPPKMHDLIVAVGLFVLFSVHSVIEGIGLGTASPRSATSIGIAIFMHKGLAAFSVGSSLLECGVVPWRLAVSIAAFACMSPFGVLLGLMAVDVSPQCLAILMSAAAGSFLYVSTMEFIPKAMAYHHHDSSGPRKDMFCKTAMIVFGTLAVNFTEFR